MRRPQGRARTSLLPKAFAVPSELTARICITDSKPYIKFYFLCLGEERERWCFKEAGGAGEGNTGVIM